MGFCLKIVLKTDFGAKKISYQVAFVTSSPKIIMKKMGWVTVNILT